MPLHESLNADFLQIRKARVVLFSTFAICGFSFGIYSAGFSDISLISLVRTFSCYRVSTVGRILAVLLPFVFAYIAVALSDVLLLYPLIFIKCFLYSFYMFYIDAAFEQGSWLACLLLSWTDAVVLFALFLFGVHYISGFADKVYFSLFAVAVVAIGFGVADILFIEPFLATLLS